MIAKFALRFALVTAIMLVTFAALGNLSGTEDYVVCFVFGLSYAAVNLRRDRKAESLRRHPPETGIVN